MKLSERASAEIAERNNKRKEDKTGKWTNFVSF